MCDLRATAAAAGSRYDVGTDRLGGAGCVAATNKNRGGQQLRETKKEEQFRTTQLTLGRGVYMEPPMSRALVRSLLVFVPAHFSLPQLRLPMTVGSIAAPSRTALANGAVATTIARATRALHRRRAAG